jgi:hypothetical protein
MILLGGYWMPYDAARQLASNLGIDTGPDTKLHNGRMEYPFNNWLHDQGMLHVKSAVISWPDDTPSSQLGLTFISHFRRPDWVMGESIELAQREQDLEVRKWLEESGGVEPKHLQWISLLDTKRITLNGMKPRRCDIKWPDGFISNEEFKVAHEAQRERTRESRMAVIRKARYGSAT